MYATCTGVRHCSGYGTGGDGSVPVHDLLKLCLAQRCPWCLHLPGNRHKQWSRCESSQLQECIWNEHCINVWAIYWFNDYNYHYYNSTTHILTGLQDRSPLFHMVAGVRMGRLVQGALGCRSGACCCCRVGERTQDWREVPEVVHLVGGLACEEVAPRPSGAQWGLEDEEGRVLGVVVPVEGVGDQGEVRNLEEGGLGAGDPLEVGRTDQGRVQGEEACRHDLVDQRGEGGGPGQEVVVLEGQGDQEDLEGGVGDPACHLKESTNNKREVHETKEDLITIFCLC